jgi:hypothetical protein
VKPKIPCVTKTYEEEKLAIQQVISGRIIFRVIGSSGNSRISISSSNNSQVSTLCGGGSTKKFKMVGLVQLLGYQSSKDKGWMNQKIICSFAIIFGKIRKLHMKIQSLQSWKSHSKTTQWIGISFS